MSEFNLLKVKIHIQTQIIFLVLHLFFPIQVQYLFLVLHMKLGIFSNSNTFSQYILTQNNELYVLD